MKQTILNCESISYSYSAKEVLHNISLEVRAGEFIALVGPNGAGKSTLLKLLAGFFLPKSGQVFIKSIPLPKYKHKELAQQLSYVPQKMLTFFSFSVTEFVLMGRAPYLGGWGWASDLDYKKVDEVLRLTHTEEFKDRTINELSGGELQRVLLAQALVQEASLLLLDEPLTHLDLTYQIEFMELLRNANKHDNLTILIVLHDINLASQYADRLILVQNGEIIGDGEPNALITEETLDKLYAASVNVFPHPLTGKPIVLPVPKYY